MTRLAISQVVELGLHRPFGEPSGIYSFRVASGDTFANKEPAHIKPSNEHRRAALGCFVVTSWYVFLTVPMQLRRLQLTKDQDIHVDEEGRRTPMDILSRGHDGTSAKRVGLGWRQNTCGQCQSATAPGTTVQSPISSCCWRPGSGQGPTQRASLILYQPAQANIARFAVLFA